MKKLFFLLTIMFLGLIVEAQNCSANFTYTISGSTVYFSDTSLNYQGYMYYWTFGDGTTGNGKHVQHTYTVTGAYSVCLTIADSLTGCYSQYCDSLYVNAGCKALFASQISGNTVNFLDASTGYSGSVYSWNFGDGNGSSSKNPQHTYSSTGTYYVCLAIFDLSNNCSDTFCKYVTIGQSSCQANFTHQKSGNTVNFHDGSTNYYDSIYLWSFGDGNTSTNKNPQHTYFSPGTYNVCLTIVDSFTNCFDTYCNNITITGPSCQAMFFDSISGSTVFFSDTSINYQGNYYYWYFGDGSSGTGKNIQHTYLLTGVYSICLTIADSSTGCYSQYCDSLYVIAGCNASFTYQKSGNTVSFVDASMGYSGNTYLWDFGDWNTSSSQNPQHTYSLPGTYNVSLTIIDSSSNCMDSTVQSVIIQNSNAIYGSVMAGSNYTIAGSVFLILYNPNDSTLTAIDTVSIDSGGYTFTNFPNGSYLVKAALSGFSPYYVSYIPTYYGNVLFWNQATYVTINNSQQAATINLVAGINPGGPGFIGGKTSQGANAVLDPGDPIESVQILLLDDTDNPILYDYSDAIGSFDFDDLAYGTYKIYAEVLGKNTIPAIVTIDEATPSISNVRIIIGSEDITSEINYNLSEYLESVGNLYPNPILDFVSIELSVIEPINVSYTILDQVGHIVYSNVKSLNKGLSNIEINTSDLSSGIYYLKINTSDKVEIMRKFMKIK